MQDSDKTVEEKENLKKLVDIYWGRYNGDRFYKDELLDLVTEVSAASRREDIGIFKDVFWEIYHKNSESYEDSLKNNNHEASNEAAYTTAVLNSLIKGLTDRGIELLEL